MDVLIGWPGGDWQTTLQLVVVLLLGYYWLIAIPWAYRDIRSRTHDPLSQLIGVALVVALPLLGIPLYLVLRPSETLQQLHDRQIEQEAILSELYSVSACPSCRRPVQDDFMACPYCRAVLKEPCASCSRLLMRAWRHCPYCATSRAPVRAAGRRGDRDDSDFDAYDERDDLDTELAPGARRRQQRSGASGESAAP